MSKSVVRVFRRGEPDVFRGTAFFISTEHLLTCRHVLEDQGGNLIPAREIILKNDAAWPGGGVRSIEKYQCHDQDLDVAVLAIDKAVPDAAVIPIPPSHQADLAANDTVTAYGFTTPDGSVETPSLTITAYSGRHRLDEAHTAIGKGMSGGPVLRNNFLVGITQAKDGEHTFIIPVKRIREFIQPFWQEGLSQDSSSHSIEGRFDLLCDRVDQESNFIKQFKNRLESKEPLGWLLFGELNQGHFQMFERIIYHTLKQCLKNQGGAFKIIQLNNMSKKYRDINDLKARVLFELEPHLGELNDLRNLHEALDGNFVAFIHTVIHEVKDEQQARIWDEALQSIIKDLQESRQWRTLVVFAFSIEYIPQHGLKYLLTRSKTIQKYFMDKFPEHFSDDGAVAPFDRTTGQLIDRLTPAKIEHISDWCDNTIVKAGLKNRLPTRQSLIDEIFGGKDELPMENVLIKLKELR